VNFGAPLRLLNKLTNHQNAPRDRKISGRFDLSDGLKLFALNHKEDLGFPTKIKGAEAN
jgi:hypothetical protein